MVLTQGEHTTIHNRFIDRKGENNGMYGKHQSDEAKKKISSKMSGKKNHLGIHHSPESRIKCGADKKGKHWKVVDGVRVWF